MKTNKKGISLIVLVITIIVMLVLAGAIIVTLTNNGIIGRAKDARDKTNLNEVKEAANLLWSEAFLNNIRDQEGLEDAVINGLTAQKVDTTKYTITVTTNGVTVELKDDGEDDDTTPTQLSAPTIAISQDTLTITDNAANGDNTEQFEVYVGTEKKTTVAKGTTTTLDLTTLNLEAGTHSITVKATGTGVTASAASNAVEYTVQAVVTLAGTWVFNETLTVPTGELVETELSYTSGSASFKGMKMNTDLYYTNPTLTPTAFVESDNPSFVLLAQADFVEDPTAKDGPVYYGGSWTLVAYRTVNFGTEPQEVSQEFYTWFTANAVQQ